MNESVVERSLDVADGEDVLGVLARLRVGRAVVDDLLLLLLIGSLLLCFGLYKYKRERHIINLADLSIRGAQELPP